MTLRGRPYFHYFLWTIALFLASTVGSDVIARVVSRDQSASKALLEHLQNAVTQPLGTVFLLVPFLVLYGMSSSVAARPQGKHGLAVFLVGTLLLGFTYFSAFQDSQSYMKQRMWTAATLSVAFLPFKSIPTLLLCFVLRWFLGRSKRAAEA
jgi:hypothetical protein